MTFRAVVFLFGLGAAGGLVGDAGNVQSGVLAYGPETFASSAEIWKSAWWFPILVGLGTVCVGLTRVRVSPARPETDFRIGVGAFAAVMATYAVGSIQFGGQNDSVAKVALCAAIAALLACAVADLPGIVCGIAVAAAGPVVEILIASQNVSFYLPWDDGYLGVPFWLIPLYFAFGVAVSRITELLVARRA